jgi:hypothetical protein
MHWAHWGTHCLSSYLSEGSLNHASGCKCRHLEVHSTLQGSHHASMHRRNQARAIARHGRPALILRALVSLRGSILQAADGSGDKQYHSHVHSHVKHTGVFCMCMHACCSREAVPGRCTSTWPFGTSSSPINMLGVCVRPAGWLAFPRACYQAEHCVWPHANCLARSRSSYVDPPIAAVRLHV